jgi:cytochrome oxidase Cu insertion factor (SCO1/SenC/PrrC family)
MTRRQGASTPVLALLVILAVTGAWWALALWPAGSVEPGWLERTRAACFGSSRGGLPDAGGWILLIGEPLGMLGVLLIGWGRTLRADLTRLANHRGWRVAGVGVLAAVLLGVGLAVWRVRNLAAQSEVARAGSGIMSPFQVAAPSMPLVDQNGRATSLANLEGPVLLTFAFGHCGTLCPLTVHNALAARKKASRIDLRLAVLTLDPWRDTPERLPTLARQWGLGPDDQVLSGDIPSVERTLDRLGIGRRRDSLTGDLEHGETVILLDGSGQIVGRLDGGWDRMDELMRMIKRAPEGRSVGAP